MSKAILIIDTNDCAGCPVAIHDEIDGYSMCQAMGLKDIPDHFSKPDWCPLIPEPKRQLNSAQHVIGESQKTGQDLKLITGYHLGWNACLDELEGKGNA